MKKVIIISSVISALFCGDISGVSYFNYATGDADAGEAHGFSMERAYFTYVNNLSDAVSFKFQTDARNSGDGNGLNVYIKNAQMSYQATDNFTMIYGMQTMNMFDVQEQTWGNRYLAKTSMDENGWGPSADLGIGLAASFETSFADISGSFLFTNGEGYWNPSSDGNERMSGSLSISKDINDDISLNAGGAFSMLNYTSGCDCDGNCACGATCSADGCVDGCDCGCGCGADMTAQVMGVFGGFSGFGLRSGFEYNMGTDLNLGGYGTSSTLMSFYGTYDVSFVEGLSVMVKYDALDTDVDADDTESTTLLAGVSYKCAEGITFSPNMTQTTQYNADDDDMETTTGINLSFKLEF